ncbi:hypothetical protein JCM10207_005149 [Rhodosporidiobolus poonsookiae]
MAPDPAANDGGSSTTNSRSSRLPSRRPSLRSAGLAGQPYSPEMSPADSDAGAETPSEVGAAEESPFDTPPRIRSTSHRRNSAASSNTPPPQPGTFLARFLGQFRPNAGTPTRPPLPRSLSTPMYLQTDVPTEESEPSPPPQPSGSTLAVPGGFPPSPAPSNASTSSLAKRLKPSFRRAKSQIGTPKSSPSASPAASPGLAMEQPMASPGSPATLRSHERDPMERASTLMADLADEDSNAGSWRGSSGPGGGMLRRGSVLSQMTVQARDHAYPSGTPQATPLQPIEEPSFANPPRLEHSLELIATLLPPALLLLSQLGPTHLFSPPLQLPSLFEATLAAAASRKSSVSSASGSNALLSSSASIASSATGSTTNSFSTSAYAIPTTDHLIPSHSHELHAPSTLSVPAVSAAAIWRLFRGFEWIGEVGKGEQPLPPSPIPRHLGGLGGGPPLEPEDEPEQVFDFPAVLQGVADVVAADAAARNIELVIGQVGSGSAPSPAATPGLMADKAKAPLEDRPKKDTESRELLVRADERAWSVTLVWIFHHILAAAPNGSTVDVRFLATNATPPSSPTRSREDLNDLKDPTFSPSRPQKWWTVSVEILLTVPPQPTLSPPFPDETTAPPAPPPLPTPPFDDTFAKTLFSLVQLNLGPGPGDSTSKSWLLEALLPAARPRTQSIAEDPSSLLGRRRASLEVPVGQEPTMNDLKRFATTALKGLRVALHAGEHSNYAKHLTSYLAGWGMDVQHVPVEHESLSSGSTYDPKMRPSGTARFDSGFETAGPSPGNSEGGKSAEAGTAGSSAPGDASSSLVIIDDDVATLRRLLVSLRAPPLHLAPTLLAKRPQLASRRTRSSPHVRQLHQLSQAQSASQWVIIHFASLTHYKTIKEIVQDTLATSRSPNMPEVLVVPKPAGPRRIITAIWTALKRPAVDPSLPPIATSPTSPGIQYWTPRLSPALAKEHEFDFSGEPNKTGEGPPGATLGKPRTPPVYFNAAGQPIATGLPPSPLGRVQETQDSYFATVADEIKEATPSEGMIVQSPDGRSGIFFQPQPKLSRSSSTRDKGVSRVSERDRSASVDDIPEEDPLDESPPLATATAGGSSESSSGPPSRLSTYTPLEMGLGSSIVKSRIPSGSSSHTTSGNVPTVPSSIPPSTPALSLDSFIAAAATGRPLDDTPPEEGPLGETLSHTSSTRGNPPSTRRSLSGSSGAATNGSFSSAGSPRSATSGVTSPLFSPVRRPTASVLPSPAISPPPAMPGPAAQAGAAAAAAARANMAAPSPVSPSAATRRRGTITSIPKNKRRASRRATLPAVPPISVLIVEDNPINQTILSVFMKKKGISYKVAKDGEQAVQMWKKGNFHLVLMDIQLPVKDGIEATREIREMERQNNIGTFITTPTSDIASPTSTISSNPLSAPSSPLLSMPVIIVALTASSLQADRISALAAGCNDFLTKPVSLTWLESKLVEWGSMAYLSGFSRKPESSDSSILSSGSRAVTPARPLSPVSPTEPDYREGFATQANRISQHLHIDRQPSRSSSPANARHDLGASPFSSPEPSPPSGNTLGSVMATEPRPHRPHLTLTEATPHHTPGPVPAIPGATDTPAPAAGGDAQDTLDRVGQRLEGLVQEHEEREHGHPLPHRPGPTPLPPSVLTAEEEEPALDDVMAEGNRLLEARRSRANSESFGQAMADSGSNVSSAQGSANSVSLSQLPPPIE